MRIRTRPRTKRDDDWQLPGAREMRRRGPPLLDLSPSDRNPVEPELAALDAVGEELAHPRRVLARATGSVEPRLELDSPFQRARFHHAEPGAGEEGAPFLLGVIAHMGRIAEAARFLVRVAHAEVVHDEDEVARHPGHLPDTGLHV